MSDDKPSRKTQILQSLAALLEAQPGSRITTAALAREVGVSEAALYRHFPSKARMFEELIGFAEESIFSRINRITSQGNSLSQIDQIGQLVLGFVARNPGITRLLNGDALNGENPRLHQRIEQFYSRLESQIKQILREAAMREQRHTRSSTGITASLLLAVMEGHIAHFARSNFRHDPAQHWQDQWPLLAPTVFRSETQATP